MTIEEEAKECREACKNAKVGDWMWLIHHEVLIEKLTESVENRISFILTSKALEEQARRLHYMRPVTPEQLTELETSADWQKAYADWQKARADYEKAEADWQKAYADLQKAEADWQKARADWWKAGADLRKADADWWKAGADLRKADADWQKSAEAVYRKYFPDSPWNGKTLFHQA